MFKTNRELRKVIDKLVEKNHELTKNNLLKIDLLVGANNQLVSTIISKNSTINNLAKHCDERITSLKMQNKSLMEQIADLKMQLEKNEEKKEEKKIKKCYYKIVDFYCVDRCPSDENIGIGSTSCNSCKNNIGHDDDEKWIKCALMPEGKPIKK